MIHVIKNRDKAIAVEIEGEIFPAVNIQVPENYPRPIFDKDLRWFFWVYFEVMFENGVSATVYQVENRTSFVVEITQVQDGHNVFHAYNCHDENELAEALWQEKRINTLAGLDVA